MTKSNGRPPKAIKQEKFIGYFVTHVQYSIIRQKADLARVNISDYMRQMAINGHVKARWSQEERDLFKKLVGMANDLNQLVKLARQEGVIQAMDHFTRYREQMNEVLKSFSCDQ